MRTRHLIEELRRDGQRRDREAEQWKLEAEQRAEQWKREAEQRDREAEQRHRESVARIAQIQTQIEQTKEESRRDALRTEAAIRESRQATRAMLAELRDHGERMRVGFDATYGALCDLSREIRGWRD